MDWTEMDRQVLDSIRLLVSMVQSGVYDLREGEKVFNRFFEGIEEISLKDLVIICWALVFELAYRGIKKEENSPIYG